MIGNNSIGLYPCLQKPPEHDENIVYTKHNSALQSGDNDENNSIGL
jgi:hypothetical protein